MDDLDGEAVEELAIAVDVDLAVSVCVLPLKIDNSSFVSPPGLDGLKISLGILGGRPSAASRKAC